MTNIAKAHIRVRPAGWNSRILVGLDKAGFIPAKETHDVSVLSTCCLAETIVLIVPQSPLLVLMHQCPRCGRCADALVL